MKKILFSISFCLSVLFSFSQGITFDHLEYDFGRINEDSGKVIHVFSFVNKSSSALKIDTVTTECHCTSPGWTNESIKPKEKGEVIAEYDPYDSPGEFEKKITVEVQGKKIELLIKGLVEPRLKSDVEQELPYLVGGVRLQKKYLQLGHIYNNKPFEKSFRIYNDTDKDIVFLKSKFVVPAYIKLQLPDTLKSKQYNRIELTYYPKKKNDWGYQMEDISLKTNAPKDNVIELKVLTTIMHYFDPEEIKTKMPKVRMDTVAVSFGTLKQHVEKEHTFTVKNEGNANLEILKIKAACTCVEFVAEPLIIKPGKQGVIKVKFLTEDRNGTQIKKIHVFFNDPNYPAIQLEVKGKVVE